MRFAGPTNRTLGTCDIAKRVLEINALLFILMVLVYNCDTHVA